MNGDVERVLESCASPIRELARGTCSAVLAIFPDAVITVENQNPRFGTTIGFGTTTGYKGLRFSVTPQRTHVTLGIAHGAGLQDPSGLMEGAGKVHRHLKLRQLQDLDRPELHQLLAAAMAQGR
jgi:Domain of unknown function (DU1801)